MQASTRAKHGLLIASVITALNVLVASGYSIAGILKPELVLPAGTVPTEGAFIFALYAAARTLPLAVITLVIIYKRSVGAMLILGLLAGLIQFADAIIGAYQHDIGKTILPFVLAVLQLYSLTLLMNNAKTPKENIHQ